MLYVPPSAPFAHPAAFLETSSSLVGAVIYNSALFPLFLVPVAFVAVTATLTMSMLNGAVTRYSDVEVYAMEPLQTLLNDLLAGGPVIRASGRQASFLAKAGVMVEELEAANLANFALTRWAGVRLEILAALLLLSTALLCANAGDAVSPAAAGLAVTYALSFGQLIASFAAAVTSLLTCLTSVERVDALSRVEPEERWPEPGTVAPPPLPTDTRRPPPDSAVVAALRAQPRSSERRTRYPYPGWDPECWAPKLRDVGWPVRGDIELDRVTARYGPDLPPALRRITLVISGRSSLGVIGRPGSGKSSLLAALLRIIEPDAPPETLLGARTSYGHILIDGVATADVPLAQLRSAVGYVGPTPDIIGGLTVTQNLDPTGAASAETLWAALEECSLAATVRALPKGLDTPMADGGEDLSPGHRQLLSFARVLVRRPRLVLLDEATSRVDPESSTAIRRAIVACSRTATIVCVAYNLRTIMPADRVLTLDGGEIADFDAPSALLGITGLEEPPRFHARSGTLVELVGHAGPVEEAELRTLAAAGFLRRRLLARVRAMRRTRGAATGVTAGAQAPAAAALHQPPSAVDAELPPGSAAGVADSAIFVSNPLVE